MQDVLLNMANWLLIEYCGKHGIDCSGSYPAKKGRGFEYGLLDQTTHRSFVSLIFTKNTPPQYTWHDSARKRGMVG